MENDGDITDKKGVLATKSGQNMSERLKTNLHGWTSSTTTTDFDEKTRVSGVW